MSQVTLLANREFWGSLGKQTCHMNKCLCRCGSSSTRKPVTAISEPKVDENDKRNVSRLPALLRNRLRHVMITPSLELPNARLFNNAVDFTARRQRQIFAKYGWKSGVNPGIMWPSKEELKEIIEDEKEFEPPLQELWDNARQRKDEEDSAMRKKEQLIEASLDKMPSYMQSLRKRLQKRGHEAMQVRQKQAAILSDARDHFGFDINPNDPRYREYLDNKAEEERKRKKAAVKQQRKAPKIVKAAQSATPVKNTN